MTFKLSNALGDGTIISNFCLRYTGNVMDRSMHAAFLLLCPVPSSDHNIWLTKTRNSKLRQTNSVPSTSVFYLQRRQEIVGVAFCHPISPCAHPEVSEIVELDVLEGAFISLLFKGTNLKTNKLWNSFHRNFHYLLERNIYCYLFYRYLTNFNESHCLLVFKILFLCKNFLNSVLLVRQCESETSQPQMASPFHIYSNCQCTLLSKLCILHNTAQMQ